jgi:hypothetical protein
MKEAKIWRQFSVIIILIWHNRPMKKQLILLLLLTIAATSLYAHGLDYPERYKELQLPEYPNATLTDVGRNSSSLSDGISITLFTTDNSTALREYYEAEMNTRDWLLQETVATTKMRAAGMLDKLPFGAVFTKGGMRYQIFTTTVDHGTSVKITVVGE